MGRALRLVGKRVRLFSDPEDELKIRIENYLRTISKLRVLNNKLKNVEIALNTCVEIDIIDIEFVR